MDTFSSRWNHLSLNPDEAKTIRGGFVQDDSPCPGAQAFLCTTTYKMDGDTWTSSGLVCAKSWRHATEMVYISEDSIFWGEDIDYRVSCTA